MEFKYVLPDEYPDSDKLVVAVRLSILTLDYLCS